MKIDSSFLATTGSELEEGKTYIYKESLPYTMWRIRVDKLSEDKDGMVTIAYTVLNSIYPEDIGQKDTMTMHQGGHYYFGGMWQIYDDGTYMFPEKGVENES